MREDNILGYKNLIYKILSHYRIVYNYNRDFEEDYFHEGMVALIQHMIVTKKTIMLNL